MESKRPRRLVALASAALLAVSLALPAVVSADPVAPAFAPVTVTNQAGVFDPANGKFNSAWFNLAIANGGTSTYTQMHLTVTPNNTTVVARATLDGTKSVPTPSPICTAVGNGFDCVWPSNLGGGQTTDPITFVFAAPNDPNTGAPPATFDVNAHFTSKDHTTTSGGGSGQDRDVSADQLISINASPRLDQQTPFILSNTAPLTVSTWKKNGVATLTLPASTTGYLVDLSESEPGADVAGCDLNAGNGFAWAQYASAAVNRGATISPYLEWKTSAVWDNRGYALQSSGTIPAAPTGVVHCIPNGTGGYVVEVLKSPCSTTLTTNCIVKITTQIQGKKGALDVLVTYTVTFRTPTNGLTKPTTK